MLSFQKEFVERLALEKLRDLNFDKYKDATVEECEKPDI